MKRTVLSRYEQSADGKFIIDVASSRVEELYNDFDKSAPYIRRDLDRDLVDYLIGCAKELGGEPFFVRFTFDLPPDETNLARIRGSVNAYFLYLADDELQQLIQMFRRSAVLLLVGLSILFLAVSVNRALGAERSVVANVFAQGLTVAAWVSLWESLKIYLIEWLPHRKNILLYRRLADSQLVFGKESIAG